MKKLRVFQTVKMRRIVPGFSLKNLGTVLLFLLFLPYLLTFLLGNASLGETKAVTGDTFELLEEGSIFVSNTTSACTERIPLEVYVADKLARSIDCDYELEALKAQAVLIRSTILSEEKGKRFEGDIAIEDKNYGEGTITEKVLTAVSQTKGVYLAYEQKPISGAYFEVSNGLTRNGEEVGIVGCAYLKNVSCERDFLSEDYMGIFLYDEREFEATWEALEKKKIPEEGFQSSDSIKKELALEDITLYRDSADYVLYVERNGDYVSGEQFRVGYHISSSCFGFAREGEKIQISVRGVGHGLGMSQFAANEMAKDEKDYVEILKYFFENVTITKFE